jgi:DNA-binding NarL/FixJ family response regulator
MPVSLLKASHGAIGECLVAGNPAVFLSVHESIDFIQATEDVGADGYVFKSQIDRDLMKTLHAAA